MWLPGVLVAGAAALVAWGIQALVPAIPLLTAAVVLGIIVAQLPAARRPLTGVLAPGLSVASKRFMRIGVVLLGLKLSLIDIAGLGWVTIATTVAIVAITFAGTYALGRWFALPGHQPLLIATGFSICGASAIGAMSGVVKAKDEETATPVALVTLCGTLAIGVLPALWHPLGLDTLQFGHWVGAGVHDVGQVVATAQIAGSAALAVAIVVKLTRVLMLAPVVAIASVVEHRRTLAVSLTGATDAGRKRLPIVPLFVAGFIVAVLVRTLVPLSEPVLQAADVVQTALLAMALFGLGSAVRLATLVRTGWRALVVGLLSWALIAMLALGAVQLS
ncbi:YeiH family protein [Cryobacterium tepidiphilum]|uniref:Putative sulfate exporter family transporter n=1 Tax=Cryobacterium tepidiphilum TaxID=2486026 RepID=A0A3M8LE39_9MICO|nr:putative sulfate exporter family transporter [Cryobacterium tepidiphilum]RNE63741.1 putative sulfate exporter family transporter [Cryobacterium tepidiphilum]